MPTYYELKNPSLVKMLVIIFSSLFIALFFYTIIGIFGFLRFGIYTAPNILDSFEDSDVLALIARFLMGVCVILSYPGIC